MRVAESAKRPQSDEPMGSEASDCGSSLEIGGLENFTTVEANSSIDAEDKCMDCDRQRVHTESCEQHALCEIEFGGVCNECCNFEAIGVVRPLNQSSRRPRLAVIKAELSSYRRLTEGDNWSSPYFSVENLLQSLTKGGLMNIVWIKDKMLKPYCRCG